jgi:predicted DNA-binding protein
MEVAVELSQKTTILLTPQLHERLASLARRRGVSMGQLVRSAVEAQYGLVDPDARLDAVQALGALSLPVGSPAELKAESDPYSDDPLP